MSRDEFAVERGDWQGQASARVVAARYTEAEDLLRELAFVYHATRSVREALAESVSVPGRR